MFQPNYFYYGNIKFPEQEVEQVIAELKRSCEELIRRDEPLLSSYYLKEHQRPDKIWNKTYSKLHEDVVKRIGMYTTTQYQYQYWSQLYNKDVGHGPHHHHRMKVANFSSILSWIHFIKPTETKCMKFLDCDGNEFYPPEQNAGDIIVFPSYQWHRVEPKKDIGGRFICAGNLIFKHLDIIPPNKYKNDKNS